MIDLQNQLHRRFFCQRWGPKQFPWKHQPRWKVATEEDVLGKLPLELLDNVLGNLSNWDLKSIRLLNKGYAKIATKHLFRTILLACREEVIHVFTRIAEHPEFSKFVTSIRFDRSYYDYYVDDLTEYMMELQSTSMGTHWEFLQLAVTVSETEVEFEKHHKESLKIYKALCSEQTEIAHSRRCLIALLAQGIQTMPNVKEFIYTNLPDRYLPSETAARANGLLAREDTYNEDHYDDDKCDLIDIIEVFASVESHNVTSFVVGEGDCDDAMSFSSSLFIQMAHESGVSQGEFDPIVEKISKIAHSGYETCCRLRNHLPTVGHEIENMARVRFWQTS
ncbi:hypothetical protein K402DRAFT_423510 [Aulographum hederae CBS 113979]|uniref:F-box domain-containing protein n=1 Tax=Aulographum hederae CBS 113979 TaxID=1176131 RepID=A0A6G1GRS1_9PEZI|nr:hypothetical protein K402DRAFT_423510 [Aulographum hederae CBS 113979]